MPTIDPAWFTLPGMVGIIFVAIWRGWLIPGSTLDRITKQWEARLQEAHQREADWKTAHDRQQEIAGTAVAQTGELLKQFGVLENFIRATPTAIAQLRSLSHEEDTP